MSPRHPWLARFERDPVAAFGDLLGGYVDTAPYTKLSAPEAALSLFSPLSEKDPARLALGPAVLAWLEDRRLRSVPTGRPERQCAIREISEAFEIVSVLELVETSHVLRRDFPVWNAWVGQLILSRSRDAQAAYWRMLAQTAVPELQAMAAKAGLIDE